DGDERSTLAAARALVAAGHQVMVGARGRWSLAGVSRRVEVAPFLPDPLRDPAGFTACVAEVVRAHRIELLLPVTDASVAALLEFHERLPAGVQLPFPDLPRWREATDKERSLAAAEQAGLEIPRSIVLQGPTALAELPGPEFFPAFVKPHRSVTAGEDGGGVKLAVVPVQDPDACRATLRTLPASAFPVLLQREIVGPGEGLFLLRWEGRIVAAFAHRRLREKPPWGGVSVFRESIPLPPELLAAGTALLKALDWRGVAMIECKRDLVTGRHAFMEINGRFWGSLQLALDAGVDFPRLLAECVGGGRPSAVLSYRTGVRSRWFWGDVDHLYLRLRHGPSRLSAIGEFLAWRPAHDREETWRWGDPAPFILETMRRFGVPGRRRPRRG
ncbi:MAG TPA: hypothetical protein VL295_08990, partial [Gemmatimonadales bacterium]|nr:hypothetical protein [Gemmatimonadales bacterium]